MMENKQTLKKSNQFGFFSLFKNKWILFGLFIVLVFVSLMIGAHESVTLKNLIAMDQKAWQVMFVSRGPRTLAIILAAASLSVVGLIMQSISKNKFVSPSTVGTTDAAQLGVLITILLIGSINRVEQVAFAFVFALLSVSLFIYLINKIQFKDVIYVPLVGIMYGTILQAISTYIAQVFNREDVINGLNTGSFRLISNQNVWMLFIVLVPLILAFIYAAKFTIVAAGKDFAENLGVQYKKVVIIGLIIVAMVSATTYIMVGPLPFIGLIIPNIVTMIYGDHVKKNLITIMLFGSIFVLLNDIIARVIVYPYEVQISLIMGVVGAAIFLFIIFRRISHGK